MTNLRKDKDFSKYMQAKVFDFILGRKALSHSESKFYDAAEEVGTIPIYHFLINMFEKDDSIEFSDPILNPNMVDSIEHRVCPAAQIEQFADVNTRVFSIHIETTKLSLISRLKFDMLVKSKLKSVLINNADKFGCTKEEVLNMYFGGTGASHGVVYMFKPVQGITFIDAHGIMGYSSLLFTPIATKTHQEHTRSLWYSRKSILVISKEEAENAGFPSGYGNMIAHYNLGQLRVVLNDGKNVSIAKGCAVGFSTLKQAALNIPRDWRDYDLIICHDDIKINPLAPGEYEGGYGCTWDNVETVRGQAAAASFEFFQMIKFDPALAEMLAKEFKSIEIPDYDDIFIDLESRHAFNAFKNGETYEPLKMRSKIMETYVNFGPTFQPVAKQLEKTVANWIMSRPMNGTGFYLTWVVNKGDSNAFRLGTEDNLNMIIGKFPIIAGLVPAKGAGIIDNVAFIDKEIASLINADSDGDAILVADPESNPVFKYIKDNRLLKPLRDLSIQKGDRYKGTISFDSLLDIFVTIYANSVEIGIRTIEYYLAEVANEVLGQNIPLHPWYKGIEAIIKSAKHKTDLSILKEIDKAKMKELRKVIQMPYRRLFLNDALSTMNENGKVEDLLITKLEKPLHYMDYYYNAAIDRIAEEANTLRKNVVAPADFVEHIGIPVLDNVVEIEAEVKRLQTLHELYKNTAVGKPLNDRVAETVQIITSAAQTISIEAKQIFFREYLKTKTNKSDSAKFIMHIGFGVMSAIMKPGLKYESTAILGEYAIVDDNGDIKDSSINPSFINLNKMINSIFGKVEVEEKGKFIRYKAVKEERAALSVRIYSNRPLQPFEAKEMLVQDGMVLIEDKTFAIGDDCIMINDIYTIKQIIPAVSKDGKRILPNSLRVVLA